MRKAAAAAVVTLAVGFPAGAALAAPGSDAIPNDPPPQSLEDPAADEGSAGLWVGVVTGASGLAALAYTVRRPRPVHS